MAYPTGQLALVLQDIDRKIAGVKVRCQQVHDESLGGLTSSRIIQTLNFVKQERDYLSTVKDTPGLSAYAQEQKNDGALNVATEFTELLNTMDGVVNWIITNFPKANSGGVDYLLAQSFVNGVNTDRTFATGTLGGFRTALLALIARIA